MRGHTVEQLINARNVAGSIPNGVIRILCWCNPSVWIMALESIQSLTEMLKRNIPWGVKAAVAYGLQPYHLNVLFGYVKGSTSSNSQGL
jgi:hypothetical protein